MLSLRCAALLLALAGFAHSATDIAVAPTTTEEKVTVAQSYLTQRLSIWQKRLRLEDWKLSVRMARTNELKPRTLGNIHWDYDTHTAVIRVMDMADYKTPFQDTLKDMEETVVHELVHLKLSSLPRSEASRSAEEHAVNHLAEALLQLDRTK